MLSQTKYITFKIGRYRKFSLAVGSKTQINNSLKFYSPTGIKGKALKFILSKFPISLFIKTNKIKHEFITLIEKKFNKTFISSVCQSSCGHKQIIQLQDEKKIFGYIKIAKTNIGNTIIENESYFLNLKWKQFSKLIMQGTFNGYKYIITEDISGSSNKSLNYNQIKKYINQFKSRKKLKLRDHLRIVRLKKDLSNFNLTEYDDFLNSIIMHDDNFYNIAFEHGDFSRWNIYLKGNSIKLIDLEGAFENGLEGMDFCNYLFTENIFIKKLNLSFAIDQIINKLDKKLINVFGIYLLVCDVKMHNIKYKTKLYKDCIKILKDLKLYD